MDNNDTSSDGVGPTISSCNTSNSSFCGSSHNPDVLWPPFYSSINVLVQQCNTHGSSNMWVGVNLLILIMGLPANMGLLWLLMSSKKALSASEVLGLNLSLLDIIYCLCLPVDIYSSVHNNVSNQMLSAAEALSALNLFGCPFLLACMCVERYLAAAQPVVYMRLGKWEYRAGVCALAWLLTLLVMILEYFHGGMSMPLYLPLTTSVLFLIMLLCLVGIVWVLCKSRPGDSSGSAGSMNLKRRALKNIVAVLVPSLVAYTPLLVLVPFMSMWHPGKEDQKSNRIECFILQLLLAFPNFGLFIGPLFYLSRFRQLLPCWRKADNKVLAD